MRLSKIKLAGFKSFVDPTTIQFPTNLMGIVGPNGCGKSNVIDAVRWVMGESSAKHLRGDSMADVIFNGSSARKPVGTASIELMFDNSDGTIGGQYAGYAEISVKRSVSRDGTSLYFLNNVRCRRKDITGIFLGTGLGPRSYAIIEQGMISRLIEARPEEMRVYLEEAAGISKYKDRRRETETRIRHTRENLDRLNDLRDEVEKQIKHLERQARTAERFKKLKDSGSDCSGRSCWRCGWPSSEPEESSQMACVSERDTELQAAIAKQREVEADIEKTRQAACRRLGPAQRSSGPVLQGRRRDRAPRAGDPACARAEPPPGAGPGPGRVRPCRAHGAPSPRTRPRFSDLTPASTNWGRGSRPRGRRRRRPWTP